MKAYIGQRKCAAQPEYCEPSGKCPEKAFTFMADEKEPLGVRMALDTEKCSGCGICVSLCCGNCIELR